MIPNAMPPFDFGLGETADALREQVQRFAADQVAPIAAELDSYYGSVTKAYTDSYTEVFEFWKYRTRPPLTTEQFTIVIMALAEGLMMRSFADPSIYRDSFA